MWPFNRRLPAPERPGSTFQQLGAPFPLFEAPASNAEDYCGPATCSICGQQASVCFRLGIGCALIVPCPSCRTENGLDAFEGKPQACRNCKSVITFPLPRRARAITCYACLRAGRAAMTKDTVLGMISWDQAFEGLTHGRPRLSRPDFEMVPTESDWVRARLPKEMMFELLRTPSYSAIQADQWQFCCRQPMIYLGAWTREDFNRHAPDGHGEVIFRNVVQDVVPGLWEDDLHDVTGIYVFRCPACSRLTAHWDLA
ncbi:MAG TPA: CbrC family protein [Verrucomicrobiae bacterium]|nr:CbrC family protein [Verrucomicrobiae bacterium]